MDIRAICRQKTQFNFVAWVCHFFFSAGKSDFGFRRDGIKIRHCKLCTSFVQRRYLLLYYLFTWRIIIFLYLFAFLLCCFSSNFHFMHCIMTQISNRLQKKGGSQFVCMFFFVCLLRDYADFDDSFFVSSL